MSLIRNRFFSLFCFIVSFSILTIMGACSKDDDPSPANTGGNAGSSATGGVGGSSGVGGVAGKGGTAGTAGTATGGNGGQQTNAWKKGVVGKATKGAIVLSKNAGNIQGFTITSSAKPMGIPGTGGASGDGGSAGEAGSADAAPDTTPQVDPAQIPPNDFTQMWVPIPPYRTVLNQPWAPPRVAIILPDATSTVLEPFPNYQTEMTLDFFGGVETLVNGTPMNFYSGLSLDMATCNGRHFWISNVTDTIYEIFTDGHKEVLVNGLTPLSSIFCHPDGFLVGTALPQYSSDPLIGQPVIGAQLIKVTLDVPPVVTAITTFPVTADYGVKAVDIMISGTLPFMSNDKRVPMGMRIPVALTQAPDNKYLFGDVGGKTIYSLNQDGTGLQTLTGAPPNMVSMIVAPNGVLYAVLAPITGHIAGQPPAALQGPMVRAYDGTLWQDVHTFPAYTQAVLSSQDLRIPCPTEFADAGMETCTTPWGIFVKVEFGTTATLYIVDPINGVMYVVPLDMNDTDAGTGGSGGT